VIKKFKNPVVRAYQIEELGLSDPIGSELKILAMRLSDIEDDACINKTPNHVTEHIRVKNELVRIGRELKANQAGEINLSSYAQKT